MTRYAKHHITVAQGRILRLISKWGSWSPIGSDKPLCRHLEAVGHIAQREDGAYVRKAESE